MSKNLIKNALIGTLLFLIFVICSSVVCLDTPKHIESEQTEFEQTEFEQTEFPKTSDTSDIEIISPEDKTYSAPMSGYYPATYGFENDLDNSNPDGWTIDESGGTVNVIAGIDGHSKVLELHDTSSSYNVEAVQQFTHQTSGTIEFYFRIDDIASNRRFYSLRDASDTLAVSLRTKNDDLQYHDRSTYQNIMNIVANKWYHLRIEFDCNAETFDLYIDETKKVDDGAFCASVDSVSKFRVGTHSTNTGYYTYIDAVGYSWDVKIYSFTQDEIGSNPDGWIIGESGGFIDVIAEIGGRSKVLELFDISSSCYVEAVQQFAAQTSGTVEFYLRFCNCNISLNRVDYSLRDASDTQAVNIITINNELLYNDGETYQNVMNIVANKWYHLRIEFDCNAETFDLYVDGTKKVDDGAFCASVDSVSKFRVGTDSTNIGYYTYIDAVGYSWNIKNYSFTQDEIGSNPDGWTIGESGGTVNVIAEIDGCSKVLELHDTSSSYNVEAVQQFAAQTSGTVDFYFRVGDIASNRRFCSLRDASDTLAVRLRTKNNDLQYHDGGTYQNIMNIEANKWYHLRIEFDCNAETFDLYIDGTKKVDDGDFYASVDSVSKFRVGTHSTNKGYYTYIDKLDYSWDENYNIGDNLNEGLLLSFITNPDISFDTFEYQLDDEALIEILGNAAIPMPNNGEHSIQVFGTDSLGNYYQSEMRWFSVWI